MIQNNTVVMNFGDSRELLRELNTAHQTNMFTTEFEESGFLGLMLAALIKRIC